LAPVSAKTDVVETFRRNVSTRVAVPITVAVLWTLVVLAACGGTALAPTPLPTSSDGSPLTRLTFVNKDGSEVDLLVETADSPEERSGGLMHRESLPEGQGMLFIFEQEGKYTFYMRNTLIPLSIAFIEGEGAIIEIEDMAPLDETNLHSADEDYLYAIEANHGWFARNGIAAGSEVRIARTPPTETPPTATP
jgi:uncharacterized membrane protein (UPF0127 family)